MSCQPLLRCGFGAGLHAYFKAKLGLRPPSRYHGYQDWCPYCALCKSYVTPCPLSSTRRVLLASPLRHAEAETSRENTSSPAESSGQYLPCGSGSSSSCLLPSTPVYSPGGGEGSSGLPPTPHPGPRFCFCANGTALQRLTLEVTQWARALHGPQTAQTGVLSREQGRWGVPKERALWSSQSWHVRFYSHGVSGCRETL